MSILFTLVLIVSHALLSQGLEWPNGTYGLIKAGTGCPEGGVDWHEGTRKFDTEDSDSHNYFSDHIWNILSDESNDLYVLTAPTTPSIEVIQQFGSRSRPNEHLGTFDLNDITAEFCMKTTLDNSTDGTHWPNGSYCILKYKSCPTGFQNGTIFWDDDDFNNHNSVSGVLPDGVYTSNTRMGFCCSNFLQHFRRNNRSDIKQLFSGRGVTGWIQGWCGYFKDFKWNDGPPQTPISLPSDKPFVLLRYKYFCQTVADMNLKEVYIRWDDEDVLNTDSADGAHPYDDGGDKDHKLHFCHYSRFSHGPSVG